MVKYMVIALIAVASSTAAAEKSVETFLRRRLSDGSCVFDDFDSFDDSIWASQCSGCTYDDGSLFISGTDMAMRSINTFSSLTAITGELVKDDYCSDHFVVVSALSDFTWSWSSSVNSVKFVWDCDSKYIFGQLTSTVETCSEFRDYAIDVSITSTTVTFTDDYCGTLSLTDGIGSSSSLYVYVGADNDHGSAKWNWLNVNNCDDTADDDNGGGGGGGQTCFSSEDMIQVENGDMKHFKDVKVGDSILSANRDGEISYSKVLFLPHGENDTPTTFVEIKTESGRMIKMTRRHLLPLCSGELVVAQNLKHGSCLKTVGGDELVATTTETVINGVYTAIAENEFLVVNGFIASPFASSDGAKHAIFNQTDVDAWCSSNNWLVYESLHHHLGSDIESAPSQDCETMLEMMFSNFKDEPIGWGQNGWGYKGWKNPSSRSQ